MANQIPAGQIHIIEENWNDYICGGGGRLDFLDAMIVFSILVWIFVSVVLLIVYSRKNSKAKQKIFSGIVIPISIIFVCSLAFGIYYIPSSCFIKNLHTENSSTDNQTF